VSILSPTVKTKPQTRRSQHHPEGGRKTTLTVGCCYRAFYRGRNRRYQEEIGCCGGYFLHHHRRGGKVRRTQFGPVSAGLIWSSRRRCDTKRRSGSKFKALAAPPRALPVDGIARDVIQAPKPELESRATNSAIMNGLRSGRCCPTSRAAFGV